MSRLDTVEIAPSLIQDIDSLLESPRGVVVHNNDHNTFAEVIRVLQKAVGMSFPDAEAHALEIHLKGKSIVFVGTLEECERVAGVIETIRIGVTIEPV